MLQLKDVTLVAVDGVNVDLTVDTLKSCMTQVKFADVILFTEENMHESLPFNIIKIDPLHSAQEVGIWMVTELHKYIKTSHVLNVEWDSRIIHPECWEDKFLKYDYIGARWPYRAEGSNIGNTGFWLVSKFLLNVLADMKFGKDDVMDVDLSTVLRPILEKAHGVKFAPSEIADRFSYECVQDGPKSFGFHGLVNFLNHFSEKEMLQLIPRLSDYVVKRDAFQSLINGCGVIGAGMLLQACMRRREGMFRDE